MKPIVIFQFSDTEGPGYLATFLNQLNIPSQLVRIDQGEPVPSMISTFSGLVLMGGPMSVNDELVWIPQVIQRIQDAMSQHIPVLGHCLGGQLMSKALGGIVEVNPVKEIGWTMLQRENNHAAEKWFGYEPKVEVFEWHGDTFSIPMGASRLLTNSACANQAFAIGPHLALQCHIEMTLEMIESWSQSGGREITENKEEPTVQSGDVMIRLAHEKLPHLHRVAEHVYKEWIKNLAM